MTSIPMVLIWMCSEFATCKPPRTPEMVRGQGRDQYVESEIEMTVLCLGETWLRLAIVSPSVIASI